MLGLYGYDASIQNVYLATVSTLGERPVETLEELRAGYLDALQRLAPTLPINRSPDKFIQDRDVEDRLASFFYASVLDDLKQDQVIGDAYAPGEKRARIRRVSNALEELGSRSLEFQRVFDLMVHSIFVRSTVERAGEKTARGGTTSLAPGVIWLLVSDRHSQIDLMETLVHELTHLMMFTDELVNPQFHYSEIKKKNNFSTSAILTERRPLDKVVHSMVVGTEIILARESFLPASEEALGAHPPSAEIAAGVCAAYHSLMGLEGAKGIITPHTRKIIERCVAQCLPLSDTGVAA